MRPLSLLLSWIIAACSPRASSQEPPVSARFSVEATVGAGGALSLAELGDGGLAVGTTRGVAVFDGAAQRWFTAAPAWVRSVSAGGGRVAFGSNDGAVGVLDGRTGASGNPLKDEVTIVVMSEMGRHPQIAGDGRGHWTFTSALLIGSGIKGGQVIGEYDDNYEGKGVDVQSGAVSDSGDKLVPSHLGATLLDLAGLDYTQYTSSGRPIKAAMDV